MWKNKLFITIPRRQVGIPSTLNYVPLDSAVRQNVPLIPYPSWETNLYPAPDSNPDILVSMYRIAIDTCDRLWAVDTGMIEGGERNIFFSGLCNTCESDFKRGAKMESTPFFVINPFHFFNFVSAYTYD